MNNCYHCDAKLTADSKSKEHIILNAIGGRLKSSDLLCKKCNSEFGHQCDGILAQQLSFLSTYLNVKREKGDHPAIKGVTDPDGNEYHIAAGGKPMHAKPQVEKTENEKGLQYSISARNEEELIGILKNLKKKYPELDLDKAKDHFKHSEYYLNDYLHSEVVIGGELALRSVVKTAINYYVYTRNEKEQVKHLFPYIKGEVESDIAKHYYPRKPVYKKEPGEVAHMLHLEGNKYRKLLC